MSDTLLLVDDEKPITDSLHRLFRGEGYTVLKAHSAAEGLAIMADQSVQVVLTDHRMKEMTGCQFLSRVKQDYPDTMRLMLTGHADQKTVIAAINDASVHKFLQKPWDSAALRAHVREAFTQQAEAMRCSDNVSSVLAQELRTALSAGELMLYCQPIRQASSWHVSSVEALACWPHPQKGLIKPVVFAPIAEQSDLMVPMGEWVLRSACRQAKVWHNAGCDLSVSVKLSNNQLSIVEESERVIAIFKEIGLPPHRLRLELTASAFADASSALVESARKLHQLGVGIILDHVDIADVVLNDLHDLPIDGIKLAPCCMTYSQDRAKVAAIANAAHHLGLEIIAKEVKEPTQWQALKKLGCTAFQGDWGGGPIEASAMSRCLVLGTEAQYPRDRLIFSSGDTDVFCA